MEIHENKITVVVWNHSLIIRLSFRKRLSSLMVLTAQTIFVLVFFKSSPQLLQQIDIYECSLTNQISCVEVYQGCMLTLCSLDVPPGSTFACVDPKH